MLLPLGGLLWLLLLWLLLLLLLLLWLLPLRSGPWRVLRDLFFWVLGALI